MPRKKSPLFYDGYTPIKPADMEYKVYDYSSGDLIGKFKEIAEAKTAVDNATNGARLVIPYGITEIPDTAFFNSTKLKAVDFPSSLITIGASAFSGTGLETVVIPDGVKEIKSYAFSNLQECTSITLGNTVETIGDRFVSGTPIETITIPESVQNMSANAFNGNYTCKRILIDNYYDRLHNATSFYFGADNYGVIPGIAWLKENYTVVNYNNKDEVLGRYTTLSEARNAIVGETKDVMLILPYKDFQAPIYANFTDVPVIKEIILSGQWLFTSNSKFSGSGLKKLILPDETSIQYVYNPSIGIFENCTSLEQVKIYSSADNLIPNRCFFGCTNLQSFYDATSGKIYSIGDYAFCSCSNLYLSSLNVVTIGANAFNNSGIGDDMMGYLRITNRITAIGSNAFYNCSRLARISLEVQRDSVSGSPWGATNAQIDWAYN